MDVSQDFTDFPRSSVLLFVRLIVDMIFRYFESFWINIIRRFKIADQALYNLFKRDNCRCDIPHVATPGLRLICSIKGHESLRSKGQ